MLGGRQLHEIHTFDGKHKEAEKERFLNMVRAHSTLFILSIAPQIWFVIFRNTCHNAIAFWGAVRWVWENQRPCCFIEGQCTAGPKGIVMVMLS